MEYELILCISSKPKIRMVADGFKCEGVLSSGAGRTPAEAYDNMLKFQLEGCHNWNRTRSKVKDSAAPIYLTDVTGGLYLINKRQPVS